jgi:hypothetical protein
MSSAQILLFLIPVLVIVVLAMRNMRGRKLRLEALWIYPTVLALGGGAMIYEGPALTPLAIGLYAASIVAGAGVGWYRGRLTQITVDPATHEITSKGSVAGMILILAVFALRYGLRYFLMTPQGSGIAGLGVTRATDALLLFSVGMLIVQRIEMGLRANKLLSEARANKANASSPSS